MEFVALDFETANGTRESACSLGLALMDEEGKLLDTWYSLIKPPSTWFDPAMTAIHGLTADDVADAPTFDEVWPKAMDFIGGRIVVAHNAAFDMGILKAMLLWYGMEVPPLPYLCTVKISRKIWPDMDNHKLTHLSEEFGMEYQAHYALDDAVNCAKVFARACYGHLNELEDLRKFLIVKGIQPLALNGKGADAPAVFAPPPRPDAVEDGFLF